MEYLGSTLGYIGSIVEYIKTALGLLGLLGYEGNTEVLPTYSKVLPMYSTVAKIGLKWWFSNLILLVY